MKTFKEFIMNEEYSRGCLMVTFKSDELIRRLQDGISKKALNPLEDEENGDISSGMQKHIHMTILYGLESNVDTNKLLPLIAPYRSKLINVTDIEHFENESNVCVLKVESSISRLHYEIREQFKVNLTYNEYKPHITLAYLKKGHFYHPDFIPFQLQIKDFVFSNSEGVHKIL